LPLDIIIQYIPPFISYIPTFAVSVKMGTIELNISVSLIPAVVPIFIINPQSGTVEMHGKEVTPKWTELGETAEAGATSIVINTETNWKVCFKFRLF